MSEATTETLIWASSSSFSTRCFPAVRAPIRSTRLPGQIPQYPDRLRWHEAWPQHLPLGHLAQPHRIESIRLWDDRAGA